MKAPDYVLNKKNRPNWIPWELNLEQRQINKVIKWVKKLPKMTMEEHDECYGGMTISSGITWKIDKDSVCTSIFAIHTDFRGKEYKCDLTIDDDNELAPWDVI